MGKLEILQQQIKSIVPQCPSKIVHIDKADKDFLCVAVIGHPHSIRLYDEDHGIHEIANIEYNANKVQCYISSFETDENFQSMGLGRYIYNMALAHADMLGATFSSGDINPINNIQALSNRGIYDREEEIRFLKNAYQNLGNEIEKHDYDGFSTYKFTSTWEHGERVAMLDDAQKEIVEDYVDVIENNQM